MERMVATVQEAGTNRGLRIYFGSKEIKELEEKFGEDFFLFSNKKMIAKVDAKNETITITPFVPSNKNVNTTSLMDEELYFLQNIEEESSNPEIEIESSDAKLDFYLPMGGVGEEYYIAEVCVNGKLAFYCVAPSPSALEKDLKRVGDKHYPGLLESSLVQVKKFAEHLVYSPVPSSVAKNAYKNLVPKKIQDVAVPVEYAVPYDVELTPITNVGESSDSEMQVKKRALLAMYEINAIASQTATVEDIHLIEMDNKLLWKVDTAQGEHYFDLIKGKDITQVVMTQAIKKLA